MKSQEARSREVARKIEIVRAQLANHALAGVRLRGTDWFSWATAGGSNVVLLAAETGVAEVLITPDKAMVLTDHIEAKRLHDEEVPESLGLTLRDTAWEDEAAINRIVRDETKGGWVASDRPKGEEKPLPKELYEARWQLMESEIERYRMVGRLASQAMTEALHASAPDWTEQRLAGEGARSLWSRGLEPGLVLVAGERRGGMYRHPLAKSGSIGRMAMMVFCARGHGLFANITRFVAFGTPPDEWLQAQHQIADIEAAGFNALKPGQTCGNVFLALRSAYERHGFGEEILNHHQGGPTGYLARDAIAVSPGRGASAQIEVRERMAFAWNPSLPGAKIEDTVLVGAGGTLEILTEDPLWPARIVSGRRRPDILIR